MTGRNSTNILDVPELEFSDAQEKFLAVLPMITGFVSLLSSLWIIVEIVTTRKKVNTVYNRLLLSMSIIDVPVSLAYMTSTIPMPADDEMAPWTIGTIQTCTAQGFFHQLAVTIPFYHVSLSLYYLLIVKFGICEEKIKKYVEPFMHGSALLVGIGTGVVAAVMELLNPDQLGCWIAPYPLDCTESITNELEGTCERGDNASLYRIVFFYMPLWTCMLIVLGLNIWLYSTVYRREQKAEKAHARHHEIHGRPDIGERFRKKKTSVITSHPPSLVESTSDSSATAPGGKKKASRKSRVSFTFGQPPARILTSSTNGPILPPLNETGNRLSAVDENEDGEEKNESQPLQTSKSNGEGDSNEEGDRPSLVPPKQTQEENDEKMESSNSSFHFFDFFKNTQQRGSFFIKDDENDVPSADDENFFRNSFNSIQRIVLPERMAKRLSQKNVMRQQRSVRELTKSGNSRRSVSPNDVRFVLATIEDFPSAARQYAATYNIGARLVLYQSIAFVLGFWMVWLMPTINRIVQYSKGQNIFVLMIFTGFFEPLQGLFNVLVYRFTQYLRLRNRHPKWTTRKLLHRTFRWTFLGPPKKKEGDDDSSDSDVDDNENWSVGSDDGSDEECSKQLWNVIPKGAVGDDGKPLDLDCPAEVWKNTFSGHHHHHHHLRRSSTRSSSAEKSRLVRRMSSMLGDLMTEYADDPSILNENFVTMVGDDIFSSFEPEPYGAAFPTVYDQQSFTGLSSDYPIAAPLASTYPGVPPPSSNYPAVAPMTNFPTVQPSREYGDDSASDKSASDNEEVANLENGDPQASKNENEIAEA